MPFDPSTEQPAGWIEPRGRRKSVLYLSMYDPYVPLTGAGVRGAQFVSYLAGRFDLDLVYLDGSGEPPIPNASRRFASCISGIRYQARVDFRQFDYFVFSTALYARARELLRKRSYDFLLCDYGLAALYGLLLSRKSGVPFIYCSHNLEYLMYRDRARQDPRRWLLLPYVYLVEKTGVQRCKLLVAITDNDAQHFAKWTPNGKILVVPQGFDESVFNPFYEPQKHERKIVLYCGNYSNQFNRAVVDVVMKRILPEVLPAFPNVLFRFVGANPPKGISHPNVEFTGFVEDYVPYLKQADLVISARQQQRGFPTKIIEALACGKHIVVTPMGAWPIERDYGGLHIAELDRFGQAICDTLRVEQPVMVDDFETLKRRYSWRVNLERLAERIHSLA